jgi:inner membrane protein
MDNLTHSMTATLVSKFVRIKNETSDAQPSRTVFWLLILSVNFPDIDVAMALFGDTILSIKTHRWITHSILAAPFFALLPAAIFYRFGKIKDFRLLWLTSLIGILLHIISDLVTPYGTQLFAPFSTHRYTLSSQFIIDLYFSFGILAFILIGRYNSTRKRLWQKFGIIFMSTYLLCTFAVQRYADAQVHRLANEKGIEFQKISTLPQPLSIFDWVGIIQSNTGIYRVFFNVFDTQLELEPLPHAKDVYVEKTKQHPLAQWYFQFAHHPRLLSFTEGKNHTVEIRDIQFSAPPRLIKLFGREMGRPPFTMIFQYNDAGELTGTSFF